jgi:hypothetical protein
LPKLELVDLPFDQYQRYRVVQQIVGMVRNRLCCSRLCVLDVGGFFRTITGEDIDAPEALSFWSTGRSSDDWRSPVMAWDHWG